LSSAKVGMLLSPEAGMCNSSLVARDSSLVNVGWSKYVKSEL
jgi:hypothetical protein